jgi:hypothetical protein
MKLIYASVLVLAGTLAACHREAENPSPDLTGTYVAAATIVAAHPIVMYTQAGQVTDQAVLTRFLTRRPNQTGYFSATDAPIPSNQTLKLTFRDNNRATLLFGTGTRADSLRVEVTNREPASFLLQQLDSTNQFGVSSGQSTCDRVGKIAEYVRGVVAGKRCRMVSPSTGYSSFCRVRPVRMVGVRDGQLYVPYYSWLIQAGGCYTAVSGEWNTFGQGARGQLGAGDTLVVQEREVALHR